MTRMVLCAAVALESNYAFNSPSEDHEFTVILQFILQTLVYNPDNLI